MISAIILVLGSFSAWNASFDNSVWRWSGATGASTRESINDWTGLFVAVVLLLLRCGCLATSSLRSRMFFRFCLTAWLPPCLIAKEKAESRGRLEVQQFASAYEQNSPRMNSSFCC